MRCNQHPGGGGIPCGRHGALLISKWTNHSPLRLVLSSLSVRGFIGWIAIPVSHFHSSGVAAPPYESGLFTAFDTLWGPYNGAAAAATFSLTR